MTIYEGNDSNQKGAKDARDAIAAAEKALADAKKEGNGKAKKRRLSPFEPRVALWLVMPAGAKDGAEEILYAAPTKNMAYRAAAALAMRHFMPHYSMWLPLHGHPAEKLHECGIESDAWAEYVAANGEAVNEYLSTMYICRARYDRDAIAAIVRMLCGSAPLGLDCETDEEVGYWLAQADADIAAEAAEAEMAEREKAVREAEERLAAKKDLSEKTARPLDKPAKKDHNGVAKKKKDGEAAPKKAAAPHRKGASRNGKGKEGEDE